VIATRNPIERGETNELPEAQRDRFMMETEMGYPTAEDEKMIALDPSYLEMTKKVVDGIKPVLEPDRILQIRHLVENEIKVSEGAIDYIYRLVDATRNPEKLGVSVVPTDKGTQKIEDVISAGASPRGTIHLVQAAKFVAWLDRRMAVTPEHVQTIVPEVLLHKVFFKPGVARRSNLAKSFLNEIVKKVTPW
jgi:MoxR-like ATPase